jgi:ubiquinone/menaquinone biosynthesis C-methylase UbiE
MNATTAPACEWLGYINEEFAFDDFPAGARILDIGFGRGDQMRRVKARGCVGVGLEIDPELARNGRQSGLSVCRARAEQLPVRTSTMDGVVCKVVIPYTEEAKAIAEIARVLRPGGTARISYHGAGYFLRYLLTDANWKVRFYGLRTIVNTLFYRTTGRRLHGFLGDTLYQTDQRLRRYYLQSGLELVESRPSAAFAGAPVFIYHVLHRRS